jgi:hypothetical protein
MQLKPGLPAFSWFHAPVAAISPARQPRTSGNGRENDTTGTQRQRMPA